MVGVFKLGRMSRGVCRRAITAASSTPATTTITDIGRRSAASVRFKATPLECLDAEKRVGVTTGPERYHFVIAVTTPSCILHAWRSVGRSRQLDEPLSP